MIRGKHVREEIDKQSKIINDSKASVEDKLKALAKMIEVGLKLDLGTRLNVVRLMEHAGIDKVQPKDRKKEDNTSK